jgi:hypothetical protein
LVLSWAPQPLRAAAPMRTNASAKLRCIILFPLAWRQLTVN